MVSSREGLRREKWEHGGVAGSLSQHSLQCTPGEEEEHSEEEKEEVDDEAKDEDSKKHDTEDQQGKQSEDELGDIGAEDDVCIGEKEEEDNEEEKEVGDEHSEEESSPSPELPKRPVRPNSLVDTSKPQVILKSNQDVYMVFLKSFYIHKRIWRGIFNGAKCIDC